MFRAPFADYGKPRVEALEASATVLKSELGLLRDRLRKASGRAGRL